MDIQTQYKNYKNLVKQEKNAKRKFNNMRYSIYAGEKTGEIGCLKWELSNWTMASELSKCPRFDSSVAHLSVCQACPMFPTRYHYEICKKEYEHAYDSAVRAKQELIKSIQQSIKTVLSEVFKGR